MGAASHSTVDALRGELMGHERSRRGELESGSRIGARYRHTTPEMAVPVAAAIQERLVVVVQIAEAVLELDDPAAGCSSRSRMDGSPLTVTC